MMFENDESLADASKTTAEISRKAIEWVRSSTNASVMGSQVNIEKQLRKSVVTATKLQHAAKRKMCVGVFGASQAGKSFFIGALGGTATGRLEALFDEQLVDYLEYINPKGDKESTGVVTRFCVDRPGEVPVGHPVEVRLLSEIDVVKVLLNSFVFDVKHEVQDEGEEIEEYLLGRLSEVIQSVEKNASDGAGTVKIEDVYDLEDYCNTRLKQHPRIQLLKRIKFWDEATKYLPKLNIEGRVTFYSLLWEDVRAFTKMAERLIVALSRVGHAQQAWCELGALVDRGTDGWKRSAESVINVETLGGLGETTGRTVSITVKGGTRVKLERAELTALISELKIVMAERAFPLFEHTDLLDFPGARNRRGDVPKEDRFLEDPENQKNSFLRGKVAFLFDRYCDEQELNALLLCVGPSNQEVTTMSMMVEDWIVSTHGVTPQERDNAQTGLFFVMTKFDDAFKRAVGKGEEALVTRIQASLLEPFRKSHGLGWVDNWNSQGSFKNVFWYRNPKVDVPGLFRYRGTEPGSPEEGVQEGIREFVEQVKQVYLGNKMVHRYIANPEEAFDAAMKLNDGGISRLVEHLTPVCRPEIKRKQVSERLFRIQRDLQALVRPFYVTGDVITLRKEKTELARRLVLMLHSCAQKTHLGEFQHSIRLDENQAYGIFQSSERVAAQVVSAKRDGGTAERSSQIVTYHNLGMDDFLADLGLEHEAPMGNGDDLEDRGTESWRQQDLAERFVSDLETGWLDAVAELAGDLVALNYLGLDGELVAKLAQELLMGARRTGVTARMTEAVRVAQQFQGNARDAWVWRQVSPACAHFNCYLSWLGCRSEDSDGTEVTNLKGEPVTVFARHAYVQGDSAESEGVVVRLGEEVLLGEEVRPYAAAYFGNWLLALQATVRGNAEFQAGFSGDVEENVQLGRIIGELSALQGL